MGEFKITNFKIDWDEGLMTFNVVYNKPLKIKKLNLKDIKIGGDD